MKLGSADIKQPVSADKAKDSISADIKQPISADKEKDSVPADIKHPISGDKVLPTSGDKDKALTISEDKTISISSDDLKQMGEFLSIFTKLGFMEFSIKDITNDAKSQSNVIEAALVTRREGVDKPTSTKVSMPIASEASWHFPPENNETYVLNATLYEATSADIIRFGIWHNYINNPKRIAKCRVKNCEWGSLSIRGKFVTEVIKEYFGIENIKLASITESEPHYYYDGTSYHFEGFDCEIVYYARVDEAYWDMDGRIIMKGELYNAKDKDDILGKFEAAAKPHKFGKKKTWALISIKTDYS
jgi:hypothetical protein